MSTLKKHGQNLKAQLQSVFERLFSPFFWVKSNSLLWTEGGEKLRGKNVSFSDCGHTLQAFCIQNTGGCCGRTPQCCCSPLICMQQLFLQYYRIPIAVSHCTTFVLKMRIVSDQGGDPRTLSHRPTGARGSSDHGLHQHVHMGDFKFFPPAVTSGRVVPLCLTTSCYGLFLHQLISLLSVSSVPSPPIVESARSGVDIGWIPPHGAGALRVEVANRGRGRGYGVPGRGSTLRRILNWYPRWIGWMQESNYAI